MTLNLICALMLTASRSSTHAVFKSTSAINKPVAAINNQPPINSVAVGASPAASVFAGSASIPAPTVVPATSAALPMTVPGASSGSARSLDRESCRGGGLKRCDGCSSSASRMSFILRLYGNMWSEMYRRSAVPLDRRTRWAHRAARLTCSLLAKTALCGY